MFLYVTRVRTGFVTAIVTSLVALVLAVPVGIGTALFISEMAPLRLRRIVAPLVDLLAAVPSVVYGLWGFLILVPTLRPFEELLGRTVGRVIPIFGGTQVFGVG